MAEKIDILVVDDEEMMRELLQDVLAMEGYKVETANGGQAALARIKEIQPLLVISDIKMPGMNGFDLLKSIKERFPDTRMIMMTGYADDFTVKDALTLRADEYIIKPFNTQDLAAVGNRFWETRPCAPEKAKTSICFKREEHPEGCSSCFQTEMKRCFSGAEPDASTDRT